MRKRPFFACIVCTIVKSTILTFKTCSGGMDMGINLNLQAELSQLGQGNVGIDEAPISKKAIS